MSVRARAVVAGVAAFSLSMAAGCGSPAPAEMAEMPPASPLVGVWSLTSQTAADGTVADRPAGMILLTHSHFSAVGIVPDPSRPESVAAFQPTDAQAAALFRTTRAGSGTYTTNGSTMTWNLEVDSAPWMVGGTVAMGFNVAGDVLTLTPQSIAAADGKPFPGDTGGTLVFRRLE